MEAPVPAAEELVAPAHGEHRRSRLERLLYLLSLGGEVARDEELFPILAAAHVQQVVRARLDPLAHADRLHLELVPPPGGAPLEHGDVAAVRVDVQVVGIEVPNPDLHAARSSQYGRT